jgi:glycerol-3-phosphate acyltransferase PlsY
MAATWPIVSVPVLAAAVVWVITLGISRFASLASVLAAVTLPAVVLVEMVLANSYRPGVPFLVVTGVLALFVLFRHRGNLARLRAGTEPRVGRKNK